MRERAAGVHLLFLGPPGPERRTPPPTPPAARRPNSGPGDLSVPGVTLNDVRVTEADLARVPVGNLRVPRAEFGAVWAAAEQRNTEQAERAITDWYAAGVTVTCRWLAGVTVRLSTGRWHVAYAPVTRRSVRAYEELIEAEFLAAERLAARSPDLVERRPGWCEAIRATLRWAWRDEGPPPLVVARTGAAPTAVIGTA